MENKESLLRKRKRINSHNSDCESSKLKRNDSIDEDEESHRGLLDLSDEILLEIFKHLQPMSLGALGT